TRASRLGSDWRHDTDLNQAYPSRKTVRGTGTTSELREEQVDILIGAIDTLRADMLRAAAFQRGEWPVSPPASDAWDRERLRLLMVELKQTSCLPLLISAALLREKRFRQVTCSPSFLHSECESPHVMP
ncbi:hypothetical protein C1S70_33025, partial (plasmid) [Azospirillum argentinense]